MGESGLEARGQLAGGVPVGRKGVAGVPLKRLPVEPQSRYGEWHNNVEVRSHRPAAADP